MIKNIFENANFYIFQAACHYFSSYSELTSNETSRKVKFVAALKIASFVTLVIPVFFGVNYLVNKSLNQRAKKIEIERDGNLEERLKKVNEINLESTAVKTDHIGAGILPYCIKEDGSAHFLVAKEAKGYAKGT